MNHSPNMTMFPIFGGYSHILVQDHSKTLAEVHVFGTCCTLLSAFIVLYTQSFQQAWKCQTTCLQRKVVFQRGTILPTKIRLWRLFWNPTPPQTVKIVVGLWLHGGRKQRHRLTLKNMLDYVGTFGTLFSMCRFFVSDTLGYIPMASFEVLHKQN